MDSRVTDVKISTTQYGMQRPCINWYVLIILYHFCDRNRGAEGYQVAPFPSPMKKQLPERILRTRNKQILLQA